MTRSAVIKLARNAHLYSGVFLAPAILFFAVTGGLQTFGLHETSRDSDYKPPAILVHLGQLHKKQTLVVPVRRPQPVPQTKGTTGAVSVTPSPVTVERVHNLLPMKIFFALTSLGLVVSTLTGLYMSYNFLRNKLVLTATLLAGAALPLLLLLF